MLRLGSGEFCLGRSHGQSLFLAGMLHLASADLALSAHLAKATSDRMLCLGPADYLAPAARMAKAASRLMLRLALATTQTAVAIFGCSSENPGLLPAMLGGCSFEFAVGKEVLSATLLLCITQTMEWVWCV